MDTRRADPNTVAMKGATVGIETRRNGNVYLYRKVWHNGRCRSEYVAAGTFARLLYEAEQCIRDAQAAERAAQRAQQQQAAAAERDAWVLLAEAQQLAALAMLAAGFHRHRGEWRRRRVPPMGIEGSHARLMERLKSDELVERARAEQARRQKQQQAERAALPALPAPGDYSTEAVTAIVARTDRTDATAEDIASLQALLKERGEHLRDVGGPVRQALDRELREMTATALNRELMTGDVQRRRVALGYDQAPALERPLIDHLLLCELRLGNTEQVYTVKMHGSLSLDLARFYEAQLSAAQRRYLAAVETLARIRRVRVELARMMPDGSAEAVAVEGPGS